MIKNKMIFEKYNHAISNRNELAVLNNTVYEKNLSKKIENLQNSENVTELAEILFISSYPPRECGIATYSQDLIKALNNKFSNSLSIKVCALESNGITYPYPPEVKFILKTSIAKDYEKLAKKINQDNNIKIVLIQHEFGFYYKQEQAFLNFLFELTKPIIVAFHTVLPNPNKELKLKVKNIVSVCESVIVMTNTSAKILLKDYNIPKQKIITIAHGTHLVPHLSESFLKKKYKLEGRKVLSTFGLLSSGKGIETTIEAMSIIIKQCPEAVFLVLGKTHPEVVKHEGEIYRERLLERVEELSLQNHVKFVNNYLALPELLEYLQLTDIYIFSATDPNQAVSGTFVYAMSCACPIISTPIPHAKELLTGDTGIIYDFKNSNQLAEAAIGLLNNEPLRRSISTNTLQKIVSTAWENSAAAHAMLFQKIAGNKIVLKYNLPEINLSHLKQMTTDKGIIQFAKINQPDISSGYTLDDNARALIATSLYFYQTRDADVLEEINKYFEFIKSCIQPNGNFLNYVDKNNNFTKQNDDCNLDDANGRAIWALGYLISISDVLPKEIITQAEIILDKALCHIDNVYSPRAMAFAIKGIYFSQTTKKNSQHISILTTLANRLVQIYKHVATKNWDWFEGYLTYANSILPEAMVYAWFITGDSCYKNISINSFNFLLSKTFKMLFLLNYPELYYQYF
jgi:glycosyltransferase involved in cell wall biosynthesis